MIGAIDGSYIPIITPAGKIRYTYSNRHTKTSMTLQGICDSKRTFLDVSIGCSGKMHDARVLQYSDINLQLPNICENQYHILGDEAYPLRPWLLTPYRNTGILTPEQRNYNYHLSATRVRIENAFGLL